MSLRIGVSGKTGVEHSPQYLTAQEGDSVTVTCGYSIGMTALHWLQQNLEGRIVSLFILSLEMKKKGRMRATINTEELLSSLYIIASQPRDSATYLCAVGHSAPQSSGARTQTLQLKDIISPHSRPSKLVCLSR